MKNKESYKQAMKMLGTTNILKTFLLFIKWAINPNKALGLANKIASDVNNIKNNEPNIIAIGYLNEFFSKYLEFGRSKKEIIELNEQIDKKIKTKNKILDTLIELRKIRKKIKRLNNNHEDQLVPTKNGFGISQGVVTGTVLNFRDVKQEVPKNCIGIFPTSGVKYTNQFLKCVGLIFLNGGMTSHGAILARESNIPAVVSPNIKIMDGEEVEINGITGVVKRIVDRDN